jgi:non-specific serine/threonine protein kinase/serine/threonine-protein kinase
MPDDETNPLALTATGGTPPAPSSGARLSPSLPVPQSPRPGSNDRLKSLLAHALDLPASDRTRFIESACPDDPDLAAELLSLVAADAHVTSPVIRDGAAPLLAIAAPRPAADNEAPLPDSIGPYRILGRLGAGGMGVVYEAQQLAPSRRVALKVVSTLSPSRYAIRRLAFEAEILARLEHPGIARLYDAGTALVGGIVQPYFAMELVHGRPLLDFVRQHNLDTRAIFQLFIPICHAVHYAHTRGVVHRDLKPANILVAEGDGQAEWQSGKLAEWPSVGDRAGALRSSSTLPLHHSATSPLLPKILDFGIARCTDSDLQTITQSLDHRTFIGTVQYMSPEQAGAGRPLSASAPLREPLHPSPQSPTLPVPQSLSPSLDLRSDIYSLGVILFQLLSRKLPHDIENQPPFAAIRILQTADPRRLRAVLPAAHKDLDAVIGKALERDPARRYQSAADLAADLQRFLDDEHVLARPPSRPERLARFIRRNKLPVSAAAAILLAILAGLAGTTWQALAARRAESRATARLAETRSLVRTVLFDFNRQLADMPGSTKLQRSVLEQLEAYGKSLAAAAPDDPSLRLDLADLLVEIGKAQGSFGGPNTGEFAKAAETLDRALAIVNDLGVATTPDPSLLAVGARAALARINTESGNRPQIEDATEFSALALDLTARIAALEPDSARSLALRAQALKERAHNLFNRKDFRASLTFFRDAAATCDRARAADADDLEVLCLACATERFIANSLGENADPTLIDRREALRLLQHATSTIEDALKAHPLHTRLRYEQIALAIETNRVLAVAGDREAALAGIPSLLDLAESFAAAEPDNHVAQRAVMTSYSRAGATCGIFSFDKSLSRAERLALAQRALQYLQRTQAEFDRLHRRAWMTAEELEKYPPGIQAMIDSTRAVIEALSEPMDPSDPSPPLEPPP